MTMGVESRWRRWADGSGGGTEVWRVAAPIVLSTASMTVMEFIDRLFLSHWSTVSFRAALPAGMLAATFTLFFQALAGYAGTFVAQYHGAGEKLRCSVSTVQGIWLALLTWPFGAALAPGGGALLGLAGHAPDMLHEEAVYFGILMAGCGLASIGNALTGFFAGRGDTRTPMVASIVGNAANIILDYALIFGAFGLPRLGIAGAALATVLGGAVTNAWLLARYLGRDVQPDFRTRRTWGLEWRLLGRMVRFGLPSAVHSTIDTASFAIFLALLGSLPAVDMMANNVAFSVNMVAFMPLMGMSIAAQILVGQYQGARDSAAAERAVLSALQISWAYMGLVCASYLLIPRFYFSLFAASTGNIPFADLLSKGRPLLFLLGLWGLADAINIVLNGALKGAGDTRFVLLSALVWNWLVWMPGAVLLMRLFGDRALLPEWLLLMFNVLALAATFWTRYRRGAWKRIELIERPSA